MTKTFSIQIPRHDVTIVKSHLNVPNIHVNNTHEKAAKNSQSVIHVTHTLHDTNV